MSRAPNTLRNFNAFVEGVSFAGETNELKPPLIGEDVIEHLAGGMGGPEDIPTGFMKKMELEATFDGLTATMLAQLGNEDASITFRGGYSNGGDVTAVEIQTRGFYRETDLGSMKPKDKGATKVMATLHYCKMRIGSDLEIEVSTRDRIYAINGVNKFAAINAAIGEG